MTELLVGYARVSTEEQDVTVQREALERLGVSPDRIYVDHGLTGTNRDRPGLDQAMAACRSGDTLVVTKLDRLGVLQHQGLPWMATTGTFVVRSIAHHPVNHRLAMCVVVILVSFAGSSTVVLMGKRVSWAWRRVHGIWGRMAVCLRMSLPEGAVVSRPCSSVRRADAVRSSGL